VCRRGVDLARSSFGCLVGGRREVLSRAEHDSSVRVSPLRICSIPRAGLALPLDVLRGQFVFGSGLGTGTEKVVGGFRSLV